MTVKEIMKTDIGVCAPTNDLSVAIAVMKAHNCGFIPVVDSHGIVAGVITDRDICLALATRADRAVSRLSVDPAMSHHVFSCFPDENLKVVLATMAKHHVRRLTVLDKDGHLQGVVSIDDIVQVPRRWETPTAEEIVDAMKGIASTRRLESAVM